MSFIANIPPLDTETISDVPVIQEPSEIDELHLEDLGISSPTLHDDDESMSLLDDIPAVVDDMPAPYEPTTVDLYRRRYEEPDAVYYQLEDHICGHAGFLHSQESLEGVAVKFDAERNATFVKHGREFNVLIFGETGSYRQGQRLDALGTFCDAGKISVLPHDAIMHRFIFRLPTAATPRLTLAWHRQSQAMHRLLNHAEGVFCSAFQTGGSPVTLKPFFDPNASGTALVLPLTTDTPIYRKNREVKDKPIRGPFSQGPQGRRDDRPARGPPPYRPRRSFTPSLHQARLAVQHPITLETTYHPNVLADHRGRIFKRHRDVSLIQRDNRNERNELILPWKVESSFREGTLCIALVSFKMFNVTRRMDYETHHLYQAHVKAIRVIDESPESFDHYEVRHRRQIRQIGRRPTALDDFRSFSFPMNSSGAAVGGPDTEGDPGHIPNHHAPEAETTEETVD